MCEAIVGTTLMVASAGLQMVSGIAQANAQKAEGQAQNNYYNYLANMNEQQALIEKKAGESQSKVIQDVQKAEGKKLSISNAKFRATQSAVAAASGIPLSSVTADDILRDTLTNQALDENLLRYNADVKSYEAKTGANIRAFELQSQAQGYRYSGSNALMASKYNARNTLLGSTIGALGTLGSAAYTHASLKKVATKTGSK